MFENSELDSGPVWASVDDTRITQIGRFLRRFRIDEIPQLLNVLKGDMSIVGPRPERPFFVKKLAAQFPYYSRRLCLRPGITGWAQVIGDYDTTVENVENKLKHDFYYIENISMLLDLKIMLMTLIILGKGRGR
jgi:lipopolysaccharide/colanic/teichoic acid biosynthesis glycosyltransferase